MKNTAIAGAALALASAAAASPFPIARQDNGTSTTGILTWNDCGGSSGPVKTDCSSINVPWDYTDKDSDKKLSLKLVRVLAEKQPSKGSILTNFGGPGLPALQTLVDFAPMMLNSTGNEYDLIAFDPRGTGTSSMFSCFDDDATRAITTAKNPTKIPEPDGHGLGTLWAETGVLADACGNNTKAQEIGPLIGTAFVARDLMAVVDALDEDGKLRYWGVSYGTVLGATVAAMFPDRMDKVVLDAVANANRYYHNSGVDVDQFLSADSAWLQFLTECSAAGSPACTLADLGNTPIEISTALRVAAESYIDSPVAVNGTVVDYNMVWTAYYFLTRSISATAVQGITSTLKAIATRTDLGQLVELYAGVADSLLGAASEPLWGIKCSDQFPRYDTLQGVMGDIELYDTSSQFGAVGHSIVTTCAQWPFEARERYEGGFKGIKTANPILVLQNTYDAATSLSAAKNITAGFEGAVLLEQVGYGHGTFAQPSSCSMKKIAEYFVSGKLPEVGEKCDVDEKLFG